MTSHSMEDENIVSDAKLKCTANVTDVDFAVVFLTTRNVVYNLVRKNLFA